MSDFEGYNGTLEPTSISDTQIVEQTYTVAHNANRQQIEVKKMIVKIRFMTVLQLFIKCFICIACISFLYNGLMNFMFVKNAINYIILKLEWSNYGLWFWHLCGTFTAIIWQIVYEYKQAARQKNTIQRIDKIQ